MIGILTLHRANNYGAVLQNYALQKAIESLGYEAETIDYVIPQIDKEYSLLSAFIKRNPINMISSKYWELRNYKSGKANRDKFTAFRNKYLNISSIEYSAETIQNSQYDLYVVGSDQVWNKGIIRCDNENAFLLDFTEEKKAAYAASCGALSALIDVSKLRKFDYITVRESDLNDYLCDQGIVSKTVCDPTLLLNKEQWMGLFDNQVSVKYVYLYYIDSGRDLAARIAKDLAAKLGVEVHYPKKLDRLAVKDTYGKNTFYEGPIDFIQSIANAEFVAVSSFHGVVFSILMEKQFVAILHDTTGSRVASLLTKLNLQDRIVTSFEEYKLKQLREIDYSEVRQAIDKWREDSLSELKRICELR